MAEIKEFKASGISEPIQFKIGDDIFTGLAPTKVPAGAIVRFAELVNDGKVFAAHRIFFNDVLDEESSALFDRRMDSKEDPINLNTLIDVATWLMEEYSTVPTAPVKP